MRRACILMAVAVLCLGAETAFAQSSVSAPAIVNGTDNNTIDFGFIVEQFSIGDFVWEDDGDGIQSDEERKNKGIGGVEVVLLFNDIEVDRTTTNETGYYYFNDLSNGIYEVRIPLDQDVLNGMVSTTPNVPPYDSIDSDGVPIT